MLDLKKLEPQVEAMADYIAVTQHGARVLVNLNAPLTPSQQSAIEAKLGTKIIVYTVPLLLDSEKPIYPQISDLFKQIDKSIHNLNVDLLIPPANSTAAYLIGVAVTLASTPDDIVSIVWFKPDGTLGGIE